MNQHVAPPTDWKQILKHLGPGLIITASIVGSGELIVTPKLGSEVGFSLLWFIILGCMIKVFVQIELGRYAIAKNQTTIAAMDTVPGPRLRVSWLVWVWLFMFASLPFQVAGMMTAVAKIMTSMGMPPGMEKWWVVLVAALTGVLLASGRYRLVQNLCIAMVVLFTAFTIYALTAVQSTEYAITGANLMEGLSFQLPSNFTTAFAAFGIIGVGASELIYYPFWCLEKGYARNTGTNDGSPEWLERTRGWVRVMSIDAWLSLVIYTGATVAFYLLGAAVLGGQGKVIDNNDQVIPYLSEMYTTTYGHTGMLVFLMGGICVLFSTIFAATASNARLLLDGIKVYKLRQFDSEESYAYATKIACVALALLSMIFALSIGNIVLLVFIGALAQGLMLPFLAGAALYFRLKRHKDVATIPGKEWKFTWGTAFLTISAICMAAVGIYQFYDKVK